MLGLTFSSKLDWSSYIISIADTASKKIGALIRSMKFLSLEVDLYLYKSSIQSSMEYCCHVWASAPSCYLQLLDKLQTLMNWLNLFQFLILERGLLVILIECMIFLLSFLVVTRMSMSTVSFLVQPGSGVLRLQNAYL